ncbi:MAG: Wzz/FepE/Etk N-terminal domain-containing protein [bacterium]
MDHNSSSPVHGSRLTAHDEINLLDYWRVIKKHRKTIYGIVMATSVFAVVGSLLMSKTYKAEAVIIPVSAKSGGAGLSTLASQFGGLASLAGMGLPGAAGEGEKIIAILKSRTLTENVINRENLMPILFEKAWDAKAGKWKTDDPEKQPNMEMAVKTLRASVVTVNDIKQKTIKITGIFKTPELAARVVNAYTDELQKFINANSFTTAKRNRIFIEGQLSQNKEELLEAGKEINEFYRGNRVSSADAKVDVAIESGPGIGNRETGTSVAALDVPGSGSPVPGSDTADVSTAIESLIAQKSDIDKKLAEAKVVKNVPQQVYLTYLMLRRELLAKVNALLTTQYEMAKIEESKEDLAFQVIDKAVPPVRKFAPKRAQVCIMSFMAALFGAIFLAFFREYLERMRKLHSDTAAA